MVSKNATQIASIFVGSVFYGIYLVTFFTAMSTILLQRQATRKFQAHWLILAAACLIFACSTLNISAGLSRLIEAFNAEIIKDGAVERLGDNWRNCVRTLTVPIQTLLVNAMLTFRCWIVWERSYAVLIIPILLWIAGAACTIALGIFEEQKIISTSTLGEAIIHWPLVISVLCLSLNFYGTGMIVYKLWRMESRDGAIQHSLSRFQHTIRIVIDSAFLQALTAFILLIGTATLSYPTGFISSAAEVHVAGIAYNLILIRITRDRSTSQTSKEPTSTICFTSNPDHCHQESIFYPNSEAVTLSPSALERKEYNHKTSH